MISIGKNGELLEYLTGDNSLISAKINKIEIEFNEESGDSVGIYIDRLYAKSNKRILLLFTNISTFDFGYDGPKYSYYIDRYKLIATKEDFYFCIDPLDDSDLISPSDQNIIRSQNIEGFLI
ncbi:hypothetical protein KTO58_26580 [Chitinophaga pendula]|uniref:hypothetical protein n=1 Tax=Chitinophaga TaxID=79328 RepID=UPI000BAFAA8A|nr:MULTISPECIES: hypothetical protein [Chitinophaga]ASZ09870.1 hypothetical protein CK934_02185 [Chitinophaga sp. MD30]UCJ07188.1 hypothetical protein KTO58_26580 [Chitinophaga pendula]